MQPKYIYFDLDDTLLDHQHAEREALKELYEHVELLKEIDPDALIDTYHKINRNLWTQYAAGEIGREQLQQRRFSYTFEELDLPEEEAEKTGSVYLQCYRNHWRWIQGAREALDRIVHRFPIGILTNGFSDTQKKKVSDFGLERYARHIVITEEIGKLKPHPEVFEYATGLTNLSPGEILYVGDSYTSDIAGGTRYGWKTAWFTENGNIEQYQQPDFVFNDFEDLTDYLN